MVELETDFGLLVRRAQEGCPQAAQEVYNRYSPHIRRVVRRQLHQRLRSQFDSVDFLQSVWASFFRKGPDRYQFEAPEALVSFLCQVAYNKVVRVFRQKMMSDKSNLNRERSLEQMLEESKLDPQGPQPSPSQLAMAKERWEKLVAGQQERGRTILDMLRRGHTHEEIAGHLGLHPKAVQRLLRKLNGTGDSS